MSKSNAFETDILELILINTDLAGIGDATGLRGSSAAGSLYLALFTADPGEAGAVTNEADYTGYARKAVARGSAEWSVVDGVGDNDNEIAFAQCTAGSNTVTHFALCKAGTGGVADIVISGALTASLAVSAGITPKFAAGEVTFTEN